jgi:hypothetical protein
MMLKPCLASYSLRNRLAHGCGRVGHNHADRERARHQRVLAAMRHESGSPSVSTFEQLTVKNPAPCSLTMQVLETRLLRTCGYAERTISQEAHAILSNQKTDRTGT